MLINNFGLAIQGASAQSILSLQPRDAIIIPEAGLPATSNSVCCKALSLGEEKVSRRVPFIKGRTTIERDCFFYTKGVVIETIADRTALLEKLVDGSSGQQRVRALNTLSNFRSETNTLDPLLWTRVFAVDDEGDLYCSSAGMLVEKVRAEDIIVNERSVSAVLSDYLSDVMNITSSDIEPYLSSLVFSKIRTGGQISDKKLLMGLVSITPALLRVKEELYGSQDGKAASVHLMSAINEIFNHPTMRTVDGSEFVWSFSAINKLSVNPAINYVIDLAMPVLMMPVGYAVTTAPERTFNISMIDFIKDSTIVASNGVVSITKNGQTANCDKVYTSILEPFVAVYNSDKDEVVSALEKTQQLFVDLASAYDKCLIDQGVPSNFAAVMVASWLGIDGLYGGGAVSLDTK